MDVPARHPRRRSALRLAPLIVAGCVVAAGFVRSLRADDQAQPAFSLGGRPVAVPQASVIEPYSPPPARPRLPATPPPQPLDPPPADSLDSSRLPDHVESDAAADPTPDASSDRSAHDEPLPVFQRTGVARAAADSELPSPDRPIAQTSGVEPALIAPPSAPLVIYQPVPVAGPAEPTAPRSEGDRLALLAAGFAFGVLATFALAGVPVAIALRRPVVWPRSALAPDPDPSAKPPRSPEPAASKQTSPPAAVAPTAPTLAEQLDASRAAEQDAQRRRSAALLQTVLDNNLALQAELQRREARGGDASDSRTAGEPDASRTAPPSHSTARKPETDR